MNTSSKCHLDLFFIAGYGGTVRKRDSGVLHRLPRFGVPVSPGQQFWALVATCSLPVPGSPLSKYVHSGLFLVNLGHFELINREMVLDWWQSKATAMILQMVPVRSFIIEWYICTQTEMQVAATELNASLDFVFKHLDLQVCVNVPIPKVYTWKSLHKTACFKVWNGFVAYCIAVAELQYLFCAGYDENGQRRTQVENKLPTFRLPSELLSEFLERISWPT